MNKLIALTLALLLACPLCAQELDPVEFFGDAYAPQGDLPLSGNLQYSLSDTPSRMEFSGSGSTRARARFTFSGNGLVVTPNDEHGTCEALLDIGVSRTSATVTVAELDQGGSIAWHLRDLREAGRAWLVELKHVALDQWQLLLRAREGGRYVTVPGSKQDLGKLTLPVEVKLEFSQGKLAGKVGDVSASTKVANGGVSLALAVTDQRARLRDLKLDVLLDEAWAQDAAARLEAQRNLQRLREYATAGLLSGLAACPHPQLDTALKAYTGAELKARSGGEAAALDQIAAAHADLAAAQHEAGMALLLAGQAGAAHTRLAAADKLKRTHVTSLALAEACRRVGDETGASAALEQARKDLPEALKPELALIEGRLLASKGDLAGADRVLGAAREAWPERPEIAAFAQSASSLLQPPTLRATEFAGPLGLNVLSDMEEAQLQPLLARLAPYLERIRHWLPGEVESINGVIAVYNGPVDYLDAALLVAGENVDNVAGMYLQHGIGGGPTVMACRAFGEDELLRTLVHELWHMALAATGKDSDVPRWLNEGMAVFLSAGVVDKGVTSYGAMPSEFYGFGDDPLELLTDGALQTALAAKPSEFYVPGNVHANYLAGWAVVWLYASARPDSALLRALLNGDAEAYQRLSADVKNLHATLVKALETGIK